MFLSMTCARHMPTFLSSPPELFVKTWPAVMMRHPASKRPGLQNGKLAEIDVAAELQHLLAGGSADDARRKPGKLRPLRDLLERFDPPFRDRRIDQPGNAVGDLFESRNAQRPAHAFVAAEQIDDDRHRAPLDVLEEEGRPAVGRFADPVGNLGDFKKRIDLGGNANQLAVVMELVDEVGEIVVSHCVRGSVVIPGFRAL